MIKALLIDFGGVLYDIDTNQCIAQFNRLKAKDKPSIASLAYDAMPIIAEYESGKISTTAFLDYLSSTLSTNDIPALINAWNATLFELKANIDKVVRELAAGYPLYLLSNTNELHYKYFADECEVIFQHFTKLFLSYKMDCVKPNPLIFQKVMSEIGYFHEEILFVDDSLANIEAAQTLNINTYHINESNSIYQLSDYLHTV